MRGGRALRGEGAEEVVRHHVVPVDVLGRARVVGGVDLAAGGAVGGDGRGDQVVACRTWRAAPASGSCRPRRRWCRRSGRRRSGTPSRCRCRRRRRPSAGPRPGRSRTARTRPGSAAAWPKPPDQVQPPKDQSTLMFGYFALSLRSWLKLPRSGWSQVSATPSTRLVGGVGLVVVGVGVADRALAAGDVAEGVVDVRDLGGRAGGHQVLDVVVAAVDAPLGEVAELDLGAGGRGRWCRRWCAPRPRRWPGRSGRRCRGPGRCTSSRCRRSDRCPCTRCRSPSRPWRRRAGRRSS